MPSKYSVAFTGANFWHSFYISLSALLIFYKNLESSGGN